MPVSFTRTVTFIQEWMPLELANEARSTTHEWAGGGKFNAIATFLMFVAKNCILQYILMYQSLCFMWSCRWHLHITAGSAFAHNFTCHESISLVLWFPKIYYRQVFGLTHDLLIDKPYATVLPIMDPGTYPWAHWNYVPVHLVLYPTHYTPFATTASAENCTKIGLKSRRSK